LELASLAAVGLPVAPPPPCAELSVHADAVVASESGSAPIPRSGNASCENTDETLEGALAPASREPAATLPGSVWAKYPSIENCQRPDMVERLAATAAAIGEVDWVATEKVHGSNFCFETDGEVVEYASRSSRIGDGGKFFNARETMPKYHRYVVATFRLAQQRLKQDLKRVLVYGEYFGGYWPDGDAVPGLKKVQKGVAYSPHHHFYAFDVCLDGSEYLDFDVARELLLEAGFPLVAEPVRRGTLQEVLAVDVEALETGIPARLGLPAPSKFRIAEGVVVRPVRELKVGNDRAIVKKKAQAFWEATNQPVMALKAAADAGQMGDGSAVGKAVELARGLVNENRLRAVISKESALLDTDKAPKLAGLFGVDTLEDLAKLYSEEVESLDKKDTGLLRKAVFLMAKAFVESNIAAIREDVG